MLSVVYFALSGCGTQDADLDGAEIVAFEQPERVRTGSPATAAMRIKNTGTRDQTLFAGYSVRDPAGRWHDAPANPVELVPPGEESETEELRTPPLEMPGYYDSRVSVWSEDPEAQGAQRLADGEQTSAFRVSGEREDFDGLDGWETPGRTLGRGRLVPENVAAEGGRRRITLPANSLDGGEVESQGLHDSGFYAARIKVPDAPSSITGFFLYEPPDHASEIDIEICNDPSGRILFTTYAGGEQTHAEEVRLPFDPTKGFHDYAFSYDRNSVAFYVDGEPMKRYEGGLPDRRMRLYVNAWYPAWLGGRSPDADRYASVDWIEY